MRSPEQLGANVLYSYFTYTVWWWQDHPFSSFCCWCFWCGNEISLFPFPKTFQIFSPSFVSLDFVLRLSTIYNTYHLICITCSIVGHIDESKMLRSDLKSLENTQNKSIMNIEWATVFFLFFSPFVYLILSSIYLSLFHFKCIFHVISSVIKAYRIQYFWDRWNNVNNYNNNNGPNLLNVRYVGMKKKECRHTWKIIIFTLSHTHTQSKRESERWRFFSLRLLHCYR